MSGEVQRRDSDPLPSTGIKQEYQFVDEAAKLSAKEISRSLSAPTTSISARTPSLDFGMDSTKSGSETPVSSTCSFEIEKIDLRLLADADSPFIEPSIWNIFESVNLTGADEEVTSSQYREDFLEDDIIAHGETAEKNNTLSQGVSSSRLYKTSRPTETDPVSIISGDCCAPPVHKRSISPLQGRIDDIAGGLSTGERGLEHWSSASQTNHEEQDVTDLDDDQFLIESLLGKRVRRVRRRKVVQYLIKWKGYPEEENTWTDEADIHDNLIRVYAEMSQGREGTS